MNKSLDRLAIIGAGGFANQILCLLEDVYKNQYKKLSDFIRLYETDDYWNDRELLGIRVNKLSDFKNDDTKVIIANGNSTHREKILKQLPEQIEFANLIHPTAIISRWSSIGFNCVILAGCIIEGNTKLGNHCNLNLYTTFCHDSQAGDFFTSGPGSRINGVCKFGNHVYCGSNSTIKDKISIVDNTIVGMGAVVTKNITESGIYIGNPAQKVIK